MSKDRSSWAYCGIALAAVLLLLVAYAGAYYLMVQPEPQLVDMSGIAAHPVMVIVPEYRPVAGVNWTPFFRPMHWIDRSLRPQTWALRYDVRID